jgi:predicted permease
VRQPRPTAVAVLTLALGIAATTVLGASAYGVLLAPLPWRNGDRVVDLAETRGGHAPHFGAFSNAVYRTWREHPSTVAALAAWSTQTVTLSAGNGEAERVRVTAATASLFDVLGVRALVGAVFTDADERAPVAVLSEGFWRERFGADPRAVGARVELDGRPHVVVGVLPADAMFPDRQSRAIVPLDVPPASGNTLAMFNALALLRPGVTPMQAAAEGTARGRGAPDTGLTTNAIFGGTGAVQVHVQRLRDALVGDVRQALMILLAGVGLLLATAVANVASVQLARTATRRRELAIRTALGAGSGRVVRQLIVEGAILGMAGGLAGVGLAWTIQGALPALLPPDFPRLETLRLGAPIFVVSLATSIAVSVLIGVLPAASLRDDAPAGTLADSGTAAGTGLRTPAGRVRSMVIAFQIAVACVLLVGASLLTRSFQAMMHADRGYDPAGVVAARLSMPAGLFPTPERRYQLIERVMTRLAQLPDASDAAFTSEIPVTAGGSSSAFQMRSPVAGGAVVEATASPRLVSERFFAVLGMRVVDGRTFSAADGVASPIGVVVNESFARRYLGPSPVGASLPLAGYAPMDGPPIETTVVGIVEDVHYVTGGRASQPELYYDYRQLRGRLPVQTVTLLMRAGGDAAPLAAGLRALVRDADSHLVADNIGPLETRLLAPLARPRLYAGVLGAFAAFAVAIAAVGLFGVLSYAVAQRSRELAIRAALGAGRPTIAGLVLRQGLAVLVPGIALGLAASAWLSGMVSAQLYGIAALDRVTFAATPLLLLVIGGIACLPPALRAARLDPLRVLRGD